MSESSSEDRLDRLFQTSRTNDRAPVSDFDRKLVDLISTLTDEGQVVSLRTHVAEGWERWRKRCP